MSHKPWHWPLRLVAGAFILNSGLNKRGLTGESAQGVHGFASSGLPKVDRIDPDTFTSALSAGETALGAALLAPVVPSGIVGAGLTAFALGLNRLYWNAPGLRQKGDIRPTQDGTSIAKDVWLTGIGAALLVDAVTDRRNRNRKE